MYDAFKAVRFHSDRNAPYGCGRQEKQMRRFNMKWHLDRAFTLVEILVVLAIIAVVAALIFPVLTSAKRSAKNITCISNLHQLGQSCEMYMADHDGNLPPKPPFLTGSPQVLINPLGQYGAIVDLWHCPEYKREEPATEDVAANRVDYVARYALVCKRVDGFAATYRVIPTAGFVLAFCPYHNYASGPNNAGKPQGFFNALRIDGATQRVAKERVKIHNENWGGFGADIQSYSYHWLEFPDEQFPPTIVRNPD